MNRLINRVRQKFFPSKFEMMVMQWFQDDGDKKLRLDYNLNDKSLVLDFGGYEGQWASDIFSKYECNIIVFEPVQSFADSIQQRFKLNNKIEVCQYGLGNSSRMETIHVSANGSSTFGKSSETESIQILDIKDWIEKRNITKIDLIKINIEGGEYELLERLLDSNLIEIVENIQVQFHDISDDSRRRMNEIQKGLTKTHKPTYQYEFVWENWTKKIK
jgi:FkbM family methyltransferase